MEHNGRALKLDALDRALVAALQQDGRAPFRRLAGRLNVTEETVQRRVQQLVDGGAFRVIGVIDPLRSGRGHAMLIGVHCDPPAIREIATALAAIPDMRFVAIVTGTFDVACELVTSDRERVTETLIGVLPLIPGVRGLNSSWVLETRKTSFLWDAAATIPAGMGAPPVPCTVDLAEEGALTAFPPTSTAKNGSGEETLLTAQDRQIVELLQHNGRMSYTELAANLGTSESTARRWMLSLIDSAYLQVVAISNPFRLGFEVVVLLWLKVDLAHATAAMEALARHPAVRYLARAAGAADIVAEVIFPDRNALFAFMDGPLAAIKGIHEVSASFELTLYKRAYARFDA